ncbi:hypothetical protein JXA48_01235 [Candidatus Woesearchaeota archaeon]|nr:hypothetical protein [Candidatus Woesearchaeota archaeon]
MVFSIFKTKKETVTEQTRPVNIKELERKLRIKFPKVYDLTQEEVSKLKEEQRIYEESLNPKTQANTPSLNNYSHKIPEETTKLASIEDSSSNYMNKPSIEEYKEIMRIRNEAKNNGWSKEEQKDWEQLLVKEDEHNKKTKVGQILSGLKLHSENNSANLDQLLDKRSQPIMDKLEFFGVPRITVGTEMYHKLATYQSFTINEKSDKPIEEKESIFYEFVKHNANGQKSLLDIVSDFESTINILTTSFEKILELEESYVPNKVKGNYKKRQEAFEKSKKYIIDNNLENGFIILDEYKAKTHRVKKDGSHSYRKMPGTIIKLRKRTNPDEILAKKFNNDKTNGNGLDLSFCNSTQDITNLMHLNYMFKN